MSQFNFCQHCSGSGKKDNLICPVCLGDGVWIDIFEKKLFFDYQLSKFLLFISTIKKIFIYIIKTFLVVFFIWGLLCLIQSIFFFEGVGKTIPFFNQSKESLMFYFWLSFLGILFLTYLKQRSKEKIHTLKKLKLDTKFVSTDSSTRVGGPSHWRKTKKINVGNFLNKSAQEVIENSFFFARKARHCFIEPIHLFVGFLQQEEGAIVSTRLGLPWLKLKEKISFILAGLDHTDSFKHIVFSLETKKILIKAFLKTHQIKKERISPLRILESLIDHSEEIRNIFDDFEIKKEDVRNVIIWRDVYRDLKKRWQKLSRGASIKGRGKMNIAMTAIATPFLDAFSQDLTSLAKTGRLMPCMDREKETEEMFRFFEGGQKNIVLVGPPGTGKKSIIEGLAWKMIAEEVPKVISDKRLVSLSLSRLLAGARPGEIGQRMQIILTEVIRAGNIILFIKDIHNIIGVKTTEGEMDVSEMLAEFLERRNFMILATSITGEYERYLEGSALGQQLSLVKIEEPARNETILILESKVGIIESRNRVFVSYQSLAEIVDLSQRYLYEKFLPEKAIALLEEVAVFVKNKKGKNSFVLKEDVGELVSKKTGIPLEKVSPKETDLLLNLEGKIHQRIIGQDEAVKAVATAIKRARTELRDPKRPIVNLLFLGPTGVGKTELAKTVTDIYFGSEKKMIRLDMSEFQTKESIGRLIGDSREPRGVLTEAVRKNPFSLLLLDEIEKAHPDILNVFLQVMDDGRLTDWQGRTIDFTNLVFVATSNAASAWLQQKIREGRKIEEIKERLIKEQLSPYFKPEFLNRFDSVVVFKPLTTVELKEITKLLLGQLKKSLEAKGIFLEATEEAIEELSNQGFDPSFGARPLRRVIQEKVTDALANFLLTGQLSRRDLVILEKGGKIRVEKK